MNQKKESATVMSGKMKKENRWMNFKGGKAMIQLVRVDYRLLHGQVAFSWTAGLGADCILLVSDTLLDDPVRVASVKLAKKY